MLEVSSRSPPARYKNSDLVYLMPSLKEAGLENIVPTSSTTAQLALGDAFAIACMKYKNFTKFDFKKDDFLLVGRESAGVPDKVFNSVHEVITIPMSKNSRSLNVAVSAGIVIAESRRQFEK